MEKTKKVTPKTLIELDQINSNKTKGCCFIRKDSYNTLTIVITHYGKSSNIS